MGAIWSFPKAPSMEEEPDQTHAVSSKKARLCARNLSEQRQLIPGLPDELSVTILARAPRGSHATFKLVCRSWHQVMRSNEVYDIRKQLGVTEEWLYILTKDDMENMHWHSLDPLTGRWQRLPSMPEMVPEEEDHQPSSVWGSSRLKLSGLLKGWFFRKDSIERSPFCGCAAGAVDNSLFVLGGFSRARATKRVLRYDPRTNEWGEGAPMGTPRAYCKTALLNNKLYAVGGVNRGRGGLTPLRSAEVYEPSTNFWKPIPRMPFARAQVLPAAVLADMLKPIATGLASFRGKLCVPQSLYSWPCFVDVGGEVFDPLSNSWMEMPQGMGEGWPAKQAGTKLSVVVNDNLYALNPLSSMDGSKVEVYDCEADVWKVVLRKAPVLLDLSESESPYLLAGFRGKLHVITKDINHKVAIWRANLTDNSSSSSSKIECPPEESGAAGWKSIVNTSFGSVELVTCQVLDL